MVSTSPKRLPRKEREAQILATAHHLFARRGYAAVTMDDVAHAVGVTKPLLYAYVGNKDRLYLRSMEGASEALLDAVLAAVRSEDEPDAAFRAGVRAFFAFLDADRDAWRVLFAETLPTSGEVARSVDSHRERLTSLIADALLQTFPESRRERARTEVEALSHALLGAAEALGRWWLKTGKIPALDAADLLVSTVRPGLRERAVPPSERPLEA